MDTIMSIALLLWILSFSVCIGLLLGNPGHAKISTAELMEQYEKQFDLQQEVLKQLKEKE